jgi:hypothetical protein
MLHNETSKRPGRASAERPQEPQDKGRRDERSGSHIALRAQAVARAVFARHAGGDRARHTRRPQPVSRRRFSRSRAAGHALFRRRADICAARPHERRARRRARFTRLPTGRSARRVHAEHAAVPDRRTRRVESGRHRGACQSDEPSARGRADLRGLPAKGAGLSRRAVRRRDREPSARYVASGHRVHDIGAVVAVTQRFSRVRHGSRAKVARERAAGPARSDRGGRRPSSRRTARAELRRPRLPRLHVRHDRSAEGRAEHARRIRLQRARDRSLVFAGRQRSSARARAAVPRHRTDRACRDGVASGRAADPVLPVRTGRRARCIGRAQADVHGQRHHRLHRFARASRLHARAFRKP